MSESPLERWLLPDETIRYEANPQGRPTLAPALAWYGMWIVAGLLASCVFTADLTLGGGTRIPIPAIVPVVAAIPFLELYRIARFRSTTYAVTTRRVLVVRGVFRRALVQAIPRSGGETARYCRGGPAIYGLEPVPWLEGLGEDATEALQHALDEHDPAPLPPPPHWARAWIRRGLIALLVSALLALAAFLHAAPWKLDLRAEWRQNAPPGPVGLLGTRPSPDHYVVRLDGSFWGEGLPAHVSLTRVELDGQPLTGGGGGGSSAGSGVLRAYQRVWSDLQVPPTANQLTLVGEVRFQKGARPAIPFSFQLSANQPVERTISLWGGE